jgi:hypothetical protein
MKKAIAMKAMRKGSDSNGGKGYDDGKGEGKGKGHGKGKGKGKNDAETLLWWCTPQPEWEAAVRRICAALQDHIDHQR